MINRCKNIPLHWVALLTILIVSAGCKGTQKSSKNKDTSKPKDPGSFHISRNADGYPVVHVPNDVDPNSENWKGAELNPHPPIDPLSTREELKRFSLKPGYHLNPVLTDPDIMEPAAIKFDGNGRMYVLELRSYMQDVDADGETSPISRITRWEDRDNDGNYDHHTVFIDSLVFPRFVLPFGPNTVLSMESNEDNVYKYTDTDGDGRADKKEFFASGMGRAGNVEHQTSFLTWAMDNWLYSTYNSVRIRWTPKGVIKESTGSPHGQWGVAQDDYGKTWYQGGASGVPDYFQFPIEYGNFKAKGQLRDGFRVPYSLVHLGDAQPGMDQIKPDGSLAHVTAGAGNTVFRGDRLPKELEGDYFYGEVVARIIRRVNIEKKEGLTYLSNVYQPEHSEFIQSSDPLFRPVDLETAPDGTMYIVDMYRGIIQEGTWTPRGSYLRAKIKQYQMDKIIDHGRIWRLTYKGMGRDKTMPHMFDETSSELVDHFNNPNGWWRDKAQQLLVLRQDKSVVPKLEQMVKTSGNQLARFHALWTLEGLGALKAEMVRNLKNDSDPEMRIQAVRASETLYKYGVKSLVNDYKRLTKDPDADVVIQALLTLNKLGAKNITEIIKSAQQQNAAKGVQVVGDQILDQIAEQKKLAANKFTPEQLKLYNRGATIFANLCSSCHGENGLGTPVGDPGGPTIAPALSGSERVQGHREFVVKTLLHGMKGEIEGKTYEGSIMTSMASNDDEWIASVASYIRNSMGNEASFVTPKYVAKVRKQTAAHKSNYTYDELVHSVPHKLNPQKNWEVTASSSASMGVGSTADPAAAFNFVGWKTKEVQEPGMWYKVDLKKPVPLTEIQFDAPYDAYPKRFTVQVSTDGNNWKPVVSKVKGKKRHNTVSFDATSARYIKITENAKGDKPWFMRMLKLYVRK